MSRLRASATIACKILLSDTTIGDYTHRFATGSRLFFNLIEAFVESAAALARPP